MKDLDSLVSFLIDVEKLKQTYRYSTCPKVADSSAEHSWKLAFIASAFSDEVPGINMTHVFEMCLVHDLGEYVTGDVDAYLIHLGEVTKEKKHEMELKAMEGFRTIGSFGEKIYDLWDEFEKQKTPEAKYSKALDKMEVLLHMLYRGVEHDSSPSFTTTYADSAVKNVPELKPFLRNIKERMKIEYEKADFEWKPEYDAFP